MENFIQAITDTFKGIFMAILDTFGSVGELVFEFNEGAITGVAPFGYIVALLIAVPLATWVISKGIALIRQIRATAK